MLSSICTNAPLAEETTTRAPEKYHLSASISPDEIINMEPGGEMELILLVENNADIEDMFTVAEYTKPSGCSIVFFDDIDPTYNEIIIDPSTSVELHPTIFLPVNMISGTHTFILEVRGKTNVTLVEFNINVSGLASFTLELYMNNGNSHVVTLGRNEIPLILTNDGNCMSDVTISINHSVFSSLVFSSIVVGNGDDIVNSTEEDPIDISLYSHHTYHINEDNISQISLSMGPYQRVTVFLTAEVDHDEESNNGIVEMIFEYGESMSKNYYQFPVKIIKIDVSIVDQDGDGQPDLLISPYEEIHVGDEVHFQFEIKNNYPFPSDGLEWQIEMAGTVILRGQVGEIEPGKSNVFDEVWIPQETTDIITTMILRIIGEDFPPESYGIRVATKKAYNILSPRTCEITFLILDKEGNPISDALIYVNSNDKNTLTPIWQLDIYHTNEDGLADITVNSNRKHSITVVKGIYIEEMELETSQSEEYREETITLNGENRPGIHPINIIMGAIGVVIIMILAIIVIILMFIKKSNNNQEKSDQSWNSFSAKL